MSATRMHADEVDTDVSLVRRLLSGQFPEWADLSVERVPSSGTDNAIYRLGDELAVRLPRIQWAVASTEKEQRWLPLIAPFLPLRVPVPLAKGEPAEGYPWHWSVQPWLAGEEATRERLADLCQAAGDLAGFIAALRSIDPTGAPRPGPEGRGVPLAARDQRVRAAIAACDGLIDTRLVTEAWEASLRAPEWDDPPVWLHGDLETSNLLAMDGRVRAVIDFGAAGVGDPACDLIVAWSLFTGESRSAFRDALSVDDAMWARGRGWALSTALIALPYYLHTNPPMVARARHKIADVLADQECER